MASIIIPCFHPFHCPNFPDGEKHYIDATWNDVEGMNNKYFTTDRSVFSNTWTWDEGFFNQYRGLIK